jgi:hypothetical protein
MNAKLKYKLLKQKASQEPDPEAIRIIHELEKQKMTILRQIQFVLQKGGPVKADKFIQDKIDYSKLESKFAGWVYRDLHS